MSWKKCGVEEEWPLGLTRCGLAPLIVLLFWQHLDGGRQPAQVISLGLRQQRGLVDVVAGVQLLSPRG
jgi:hypothetical protein